MRAAIVICIIVFCALLPFARCENKTMTFSGAPPINLERITELYLTVISLIEQHNRGEMPYYLKFFDAALLRQTRYAFRQLNGYASNETQCIEWEASAVKFFQLYIIHTSAMQANAHYEYYAEFVAEKIDEPCSLQRVCLAQLRQQIEWLLRNNSLSFDANNYVLGYLLTGFTALPVYVTTTNSPPFLVVHLNENYDQERFIDEMEPTNTTSTYPILFSPDENFAYEIEIFRRAQSNVFNHLNNCPSNSQIDEFADADVNAHIKQLLENFISNRTTAVTHWHVELCCARRYTLIIYMFVFLEGEYRRLVCHPIYKKKLANEDIKTVISSQQNDLRIFYETLVRSTCLENCQLCSALKFLYESLQRMRPNVGYSRRRLTGIAVVMSLRMANETKIA